MEAWEASFLETGALLEARICVFDEKASVVFESGDCGIGRADGTGGAGGKEDQR
jgi:hypothetical protein